MPVSRIIKQQLYFGILLLFFSLPFHINAQPRDSTIIADSISKTDTIKQRATKAVRKYIQQYLNRKVNQDSTFEFKSYTVKWQIIPDTNKDIITEDSLIASIELKYNIISSSILIDSIQFYLDSNFVVLDSNGSKLNYAIQLANGDLVSMAQAKAKAKEEFPDAIWKSITLKKGKVTHYVRKGYKLGAQLSFYYFDGICKVCSYQIIRLQLDAETGKVASEIKIKTD